MTENIEQLKDITKEDIPTRRVRFLSVAPGTFASMFTKGMRFAKNFKLIEGSPDDAKLVTITYDSRMDRIIFVVESEEYAEVPINVMPPVQIVNIDLAFKPQPKKKK